MKPRPIVSVVIAAFNAEDFIITAISSALSQTMAQLEVIIVDDSSTDATVSRIQSITDERVRLYTQPSNQGPSFCRNYAIERAQGDWVAILDSDDWWDPKRLEVLLAIASKNRAHVICDDLYLSTDENTAPQITFLKSRKTVIGHITELTTITSLRMIRDDYGVLQPIISTEFIKTHSIRYKSHHRFGEDFVFLLDCLMAGAKMLLHPVPYYYYRFGHSSASSSAENPIGQCNVLEELISSPPYCEVPEIRNALQVKLKNKKLIVEETRVKQMFGHKKVWGGLFTVLRQPRLLEGFARSIMRKIMQV